ncbi:MAG: hypothetical protein RKR03_13800 [Candidatus Competibacter sp.]|nr:hypothetical protein [Candidatus Competibacter sp.]
MSLTGVEIDVATLGIKLKPNTVFVVISDDTGQVKVVEVDHQSIAKDKSFLQVAAGGAAVALGGCWKRINGTLKWFNPCV